MSSVSTNTSSPKPSETPSADLASESNPTKAVPGSVLKFKPGGNEGTPVALSVEALFVDEFLQLKDSRQPPGVRGFVMSVQRYSKSTIVHLCGPSLHSKKRLQLWIDRQEPHLEEAQAALAVGAYVVAFGSLWEGKQVKSDRLFFPPYEMHCSICKVVAPSRAPDSTIDLACIDDMAPELLRTPEYAWAASRCAWKSAVDAVSMECLEALRDWYATHSYRELYMPSLTTSSCEGGSDVMRATTLPIDSISAMTKLADGDAVKFSQDFFKRAAYLTTSNQFPLEEAAAGFGPSCTLTEAVRVENSHTARHLAQFLMAEAEAQYESMALNMAGLESLLKFVISKVIACRKAELEMLEQYFGKPGHIDHLRDISGPEPWGVISHRDLVSGLREAGLSQTPMDGDLCRSDEEQAVRACGGRPVFVTHFPAAVKPFYMLPQVSDLDPQDPIPRCENFDLVCADSELAGGSMRETDAARLVAKITAKVAAGEITEPEAFDHYVEIRRHGSAPTGGYGIGMHRLFSYICCGIPIRNVPLLPRAQGLCPD